MYSPNLNYELPSMLSDPAFWGGVILLATLIIIMIYGLAQRSKRGKNCGNLNSLLPPAGFGNLVDSAGNTQMSNFTIKGAYNACATGNFRNDYVDTCALSNAIRQGCRFLDFEIYCLDDKAVVAVSHLDTYTEKGSYNYLDLTSVFAAISNLAFSSATTDTVGTACPNPGDPLFLHFRIKSENVDVMTMLANDIQEYFSAYLLDNEFNFCNKDVFLQPIENLMGKVVIMADMSNRKIYECKQLNEYINIGTNTTVARLETYNEVIYTADNKELIDFNTKGMTVCIPNVGSSSANNDASIAFKFGVQICAMCFQTNDANLAAYNALFPTSAFVLKSPDLLAVPVTVDVPPPAADASGYNTYSGKHFSFNM